jgi:hypothetical protein
LGAPAPKDRRSYRFWKVERARHRLLGVALVRHMSPHRENHVFSDIIDFLMAYDLDKRRNMRADNKLQIARTTKSFVWRK